MKTTTFVVTAFVALTLIGCANNSNPASADLQSGTNALNQAANALSADQVRSGNDQARMEGVISAIDLKSGTVTIEKTTFRTDQRTKIERNNMHASLKDLKVGDFSQALWNPASANIVVVAGKIEAVGK